MPPTKEIKQYYFKRITELRQRYAVSLLCQLFGVSRSGYYKWTLRRGTLNRYQVSQQILDRYIGALHKAHPSFGYRALNSRLQAETGWIISNISVLRSMRRLSIQARLRRNHRRPTTGEPHAVFPNILNRRFHPDKPLSRVATPRDNAVIESVFGWFKEFLRSDYFPGSMLKEEVGAMEQILQNGTTFRLREIRGFDEYQDMEDGDYYVNSGLAGESSS